MEKAYTIWFTGLSGSGKSTLAEKTVEFLKSHGKKVQLLDGDIVRSAIGNMFGYSKEERMKMSRINCLLANLLNEQGIWVVLAAIAPYQEMRESNRKRIKNYLEVYVNCPIEVCINRDVKGLYKKALEGDVKHVVGIDCPYEIPKSFDLEVKTDIHDIDTSVEKIKQYLIEKF